MTLKPNWHDWESWRPLLELAKARFSEVVRGPGAYMISTGKSLSRAVGVDKQGILDIGESGRLRARLREFVKCASAADVFGHMAGVRFSRLKYHRHFPLADLLVSWVSTTTKNTAVEQEALALTWYVSRHYEMPPLNYKFNNSLLHRL